MRRFTSLGLFTVTVSSGLIIYQVLTRQKRRKLEHSSLPYEMSKRVALPEDGFGYPSASVSRAPFAPSEAATIAFEPVISAKAQSTASSSKAAAKKTAAKKVAKKVTKRAPARKAASKETANTTVAKKRTPGSNSRATK